MVDSEICKAAYGLATGDHALVVCSGFSEARCGLPPQTIECYMLSMVALDFRGAASSSYGGPYTVWAGVGQPRDHAMVD